MWNPETQSCGHPTELVNSRASTIYQVWSPASKLPANAVFAQILGIVVGFRVSTETEVENERLE